MAPCYCDSYNHCAAASIGVSIQAHRLRNFQKSNLELAILKELKKGPAKVKEVLDGGSIT